MACSRRLGVVLGAALLSCACDGDDAAGAPAAELPPAGLAGAPVAAPAPTGLAALPLDEKVLTVGETSFSRADHERAMVHKAAMVGLPPGQLPPDIARTLEEPAYRQLIKRGLLFEGAKKRGALVSDEEVAKERDRLVSKLSDGRTLDDVLKAMRTDEQHFLQDLRIDLSIGKMMDGIYAALPVVDEKRAKELYDADKERWANSDKASASHILVAVPPETPPDVVEQAKERAEQLRQKVVGKDKKTFADVARAESDDPSARTTGGDLGWFSRREMLPGFSQAAFALKVGEVSNVVRTDKGFHVIFGQGLQKGTSTFAQVKDRIITTETIGQRSDVETKLLAELEASVAIVRHHEPAVVEGAAPPSPAAHGGAAGGAHPGLPPPSRDNVMPGAPNPHARGEVLKAGGEGAPELKAKIDP